MLYFKSEFRHRWVLLLSAAIVSGIFSFSGAIQGEPETGPVGVGPFSRMSMTLVKSVLFVPVNVLDLDVHFGFETTKRFQALAHGQEFDPSLADSIAEVATHSQDAYIRLRFLRNISLNRFIEGTLKNARKVYEADIITKDTFEEITAALPTLYSELKTRGIKKHDLMLYRIHDDGFRTIYRGVDGTIYLDQQNYETQHRLALLGGYFVSKSEFREHLIHSLFLPAQSPSLDLLR